MAKAALRQAARARHARCVAPLPDLAELLPLCRRGWIFEQVLPAVVPVAATVTARRAGAPAAETARYAARLFAQRAATDPAYLALAANAAAPEARREFLHLCERGSAFCDPTPFAPVALAQAARITRRGKFRPFQLAPEEVADAVLLAFARRRADDDFAPALTADNHTEASRVFWAFGTLTALQLRARRVRAARTVVLVDEFGTAAPAPGLSPEHEADRVRASLNAATKVLSRTERAVFEEFRVGKSPARIAAEQESTVAAVQKHRSRAIAKIQRAALERVNRTAVLPDVWELVCAVRTEFEALVTAARAGADNPNAVEIKKELFSAAQERVAAGRGLPAERVRAKIDFACRTAFPGVPVSDYEAPEDRA